MLDVGGPISEKIEPISGIVLHAKSVFFDVKHLDAKYRDQVFARELDGFLCVR